MGDEFDVVTVIWVFYAVGGVCACIFAVVLFTCYRRRMRERLEQEIRQQGYEVGRTETGQPVPIAKDIPDQASGGAAEGAPLLDTTTSTRFREYGPESRGVPLYVDGSARTD